MNRIKVVWGRLNNTTKAILLMVIAGFSFAVMGTFVHILGQQYDWLFIAGWRMAATFLISIIIARKQNVGIFLFTNRTLWLRSIFGSCAMISIFYALTRLPVSDVAVIIETSPILVALLAPYLIGERPHWKIWIILLASIIGVILLAQPYFGEKNLAIFVALFASFAGADAMICLRRLKDIPQSTIVAQFSGTALFFITVSLLFFKQEINFSIFSNIKTAGMFLALGICGTIAQFALTKAYSLAEATLVAAATYSRVGFASIFDIILLKKSFGISSLTGMALIIGGLTWLLWQRENKEITLDKNE